MKQKSLKRKIKQFFKSEKKLEQPNFELSYFGACKNWDIEAAELRTKSNIRIIKW